MGGGPSGCFSMFLLLFSSCVSDSVCYVWEAVVPVRLLCGGRAFWVFQHVFTIIFVLCFRFSMLRMGGRRAGKAALRGGGPSGCFSMFLLLFSSCVSDSVCYVWEAVVPVRLLCGGGGAGLLGVSACFYYYFRLVFQIQYVTYGRPSCR